MDYGQFCPIAKASGLLGEKWTLLIVRDLIGGSTRFKDFQRGMSKISPTVLTKRLNELCEAGLIVRKSVPGRRGYEYFLTEAGRDLEPIIIQLGTWGMEWGRGQLSDDELDVYLLMMAYRSRIDPSHLPGRETVLQFDFHDLKQANRWWVVVVDDDVDLCEEDTGKEIDVYFESDVRTLTEVYLGDTSIAKARRERRLRVTGDSALIRSLKSWLRVSVFAGIKSRRDFPTVADSLTVNE